MKQFFLHFNYCVKVLAHSSIFIKWEIFLCHPLVSYFTGEMKL